MKDCVIIGGGPAGLTAALYLARFLHSVTVFDARGGRARMIPKTHNFAPFPDGISGPDLLDRMQSHAERYGAVIETCTVEAVERQDDGFCVTTDRGSETARYVIFAAGVVNHRPPLPDPVHDRGVARGLIRYCPVCDAYEVRDKRIAVLGSGTHGLAEARFIRDYSSTVTLIRPTGDRPLSADKIHVPDSPMSSLSLSESEVIVTLEDSTVAHFDTLYVALGTSACSKLAETLGAPLTKDGCIVTDVQRKTSIDGVYAIGDITDGLDQIAHAMGQAAIAATAIHNDMSEKDQL
ncbi:NAD(P)/FAD-dependent oxidoreductase [Loktanella sp. M215]|uniref:NAD(P)/FAD-dependent oxidoreductase n=2 Tax=Loktanella sp. M215 TaxID=2675431 RepID=UPI001F33E277|nr:NAD(P)/FAD-dependent oxidoreductase [Loktanella sp. M215]MCF7701948.1 NAD(P)-binding protein [Loktanella sp. M215]